MDNSLSHYVITKKFILQVASLLKVPMSCVHDIYLVKCHLYRLPSCFPLLLFASWDSHLLAAELARASAPWDFMISFQSVRLPESFPRAEIHLASLALFAGQGLYAMHSSFGQYSLYKPPQEHKLTFLVAVT